jgi:hypothetical protein
LKQSNSKNYHHFFPRAYLSKNGVDEDYINNVVNITIVDDHLNKREIGVKPPSKYMKAFARANKDLANTMKSHLIPDMERFGIWTDDYDQFLKMRAKAISGALRKQIIEREVDEHGQVVKGDDFEEETTNFE